MENAVLQRKEVLLASVLCIFPLMIYVVTFTSLMAFC